ncbi:MAG: universal stress protein [Proteobacteria bacterium]|nr:universal stress protein [Pseudomonadota bacterium]MBU1713989.1 universal stress protein [Pseudomonadota bacterium]
MKEIKKILVPVDFSENSQKLVKSAIYVAKKFEAEMVVAFVVQSFDNYSGFFVPHMPLAQFEEEMVQSAEKKMENFIEENMKGSGLYKSAVLSGDVAEEIVQFAGQEKIDLIVMGTHGYKGVEKVLFGSVAEKVVKLAPCPVMTINPYK